MACTTVIESESLAIDHDHNRAPSLPTECLIVGVTFTFPCSAQFKDIQSDLDQMRAARRIADKPIVVISGAGGCGKTHLVTKLFHHAQHQRLVLIHVIPLPCESANAGQPDTFYPSRPLIIAYIDLITIILLYVSQTLLTYPPLHFVVCRLGS